MAGILKKHSPGCTCCGEVTCGGVCVGGTPPAQIDVELTGLESSACLNCEFANGTYSHYFSSCVEYVTNIKMTYSWDYSNSPGGCWLNDRGSAAYLIIYLYLEDDGDYVRGDLVAEWSFRVGPRRTTVDPEQAWDFWGSTAGGATPIDCPVKIGAITMTPTYTGPTAGGWGEYCDHDSPVAITLDANP